MCHSTSGVILLIDAKVKLLYMSQNSNVVALATIRTKIEVINWALVLTIMRTCVILGKMYLTTLPFHLKCMQSLSVVRICKEEEYFTIGLRSNIG